MSLLFYIVLLSTVRYFDSKHNSVNSYSNKEQENKISFFNLRATVDDGEYSMKTKKSAKQFFFSGLRVKAVNEERFITDSVTKRFPEDNSNTIEGTSTNKQTLSVSIPSHTQYDFETVMLQTPPYPHVIQGAISQYVSQELLSKSPSHISSSYYLNNISDDEDYESSVEFSSSGSAEYVSETNHEQTVTSIPPTNSADTSFEKVSGKTDQPHEINTDQNTVTSTKQYSEKRKETIVELFDESGRIGPDFKVRDQIIFKSQPSPPVRVVDHASIDTNLLEKDIMVVDIKDFNISEVRATLTNISKLEKSVGERHRDYGSSYILPVLSRVNYDNNTVPLTFSDIPVSVSIQLSVLYLANFDSELMEYSIDIEMKLSWFDLRLINNYTKPVRIREKQILDQIWRPDPYFVNSKYSYFHYVSFPNFRMRITPQGLVTYTMRVTSVCNCFMLFCLYPHDRQTCDLKISSIAYPQTFVRFHWHSNPIRFESNIALPELQVREVRTEECEVEGKLVNSSCLRLVFELERDGGRFVVEKYIPSTLAMMFAWVAPYVPYNYEDVRIITPITVLLTLVQMEKGDKEIRTSYLTSMDVWFAAMKSFTVLSLVESLTVLALIKRSRAMEKNAFRASNELDRVNFLSEKRRLTRLYHRLDSICRFLSPLAFVFFFVYYVIFIAQGNEKGCVNRR